MADWLLSYFPPSSAYDTYIEPFAGSASVLMRKAPSTFEIYNDLDGEVVNVFRVLRDPGPRDRLAELLALTPYARDEFELAYQAHDDPVERARRTIFRAFAGFGSAAVTKGEQGFAASLAQVAVASIPPTTGADTRRTSRRSVSA
nr:DNA adenine methylase [Halomonas elongata]